LTKYSPLRDHLAGLPASQGAVTMTFRAVEELVGGLPPSARNLRTWWGNSSHVQSLQWREAGWHVATVSLGDELVRFERGRIGGSHSDAKAARRR